MTALFIATAAMMLPACQESTGDSDGDPPSTLLKSQCSRFAAACYDELPIAALQLVQFRNVTRWTKTQLAWTLADAVPNLPVADQTDAIRRAFDNWAAVANLTFQYVPDTSDADIVIQSVEDANCNDAAGFFGRAFLPGTRQAGRIELCSAADWSLDAGSNGVDLFTVVLHEIGHALGVEHLASEDAVMNARYARSHSQLTLNDARAVQQLYGSPDGTVLPERVRLPEDSVADLDAAFVALDEEPDTDLDGLPDVVEVFFFDTDPRSDDSDGDGVDDFTELFIDGTPASSSGTDRDGDGLPDKDEDFFQTDPNNPDTDDDGLPDGYELSLLGTSPTLKDTDGDGLSDDAELDLGTDPADADTDFDGITDGEDDDPFCALDSDEDGLPDGFEVVIVGSDPQSVDTDGDDLDDYAEFLLLTTDATLADTDGDGEGDFAFVVRSVLFGIAPTADDVDGDGIRNIGEEIYLGSDPTRRDSDDDGSLDGVEGLVGSDPNRADGVDSDFDGLTDLIETDLIGSDPNLADTDGDGVDDRTELATGRDVHDETR